MRLLLAAVLPLGIAAQTFQLGSSSDPCVGGAPWSTPPLRYGNFTCTFPVSSPGFYQVTLTFQEPNVVQAGGRVFNVTVGSFPAIQNLDLVREGASTSSVTISRTVPAISLDGTIKVQLTTVVRNAVLSSVTVEPGQIQVVPYVGAARDVNLGSQRLLARVIIAGKPGTPSRVYLKMGPPPTSTLDDDGAFHDAVIFMDNTDFKVKVLKMNGTVVSLE
jgi:hypothetical protein